MNRQINAFHEGALRTGDPILERRLLIGLSLIRAAQASVDDVYPRHADVNDLLSGIDRRDFVSVASHIHCLRQLAASLDPFTGSRRALHTALVEYGCRLALEDHTACAIAVLSLSERFWDESCDEIVAMKGFMRYSLIMVRGERPLVESKELPLMLALRAKRAGSALYRGFARLLQADILTYRGNLPAARRSARTAAAFGERHGLMEIVSHAHMRLAAIEGRASNYEQVLAYCAAAFQSADVIGMQRQNALFMMGKALIDLGRLDDARRVFELASVSERNAVQTLVLLGLMEVALLAGDFARFDRLRGKVGALPMAPAHRTYFIHLSALGSAAAGNIHHARALLEEGQALARACGFAFEYLELDADLQRLSEREAAIRAAKPSHDRKGVVAVVLDEIEQSHRAVRATLEATFA